MTRMGDGAYYGELVIYGGEEMRGKALHRMLEERDGVYSAKYERQRHRILSLYSCHSMQRNVLALCGRDG